MNLRTLSIRSHLSLVAASVVVVVGSLLAVAGVRQARQVREGAQANTLQLAEFVSRELSTVLGSLEDVLDGMAVSAEGPLTTTGTCESALYGTAFLPPYTNYAIVGLGGTSVCAYYTDNVPRPDISYADRDWYQRALSSDDFVLSQPLRGRSTGLWTVAVAKAVRDETGAPLGVQVSGMQLTNLQAHLDRTALPTNSVVTVTNESSIVLARSVDPELWVGNSIADAIGAPLSDLPASGIREATLLDSGEEMLFGFRDVPGTTWTVFVGVPTAEMADQVRSAMMGTGLLALLGSAVVLLLTGFGYRRITVPLEALIQSTQATVRGESERVEIEGPKEIVEMGARFDLALRQKQRMESRVAQLSRVAEQSPDPVMVTDTSGSIEYVNPAFETLTGYSLDKVLGKNPRLLKSGVHPTEFYQEFWTTILSGHLFRGVLTNRKKGGELYLEEKTVTPLRDREGTITHFVSTGKDVTEREALLTRLRDAEKLEVAGRLAAGVAHDFNNVLTAIRGHAELLTIESAAQGSDDPHQTDSLEEIIRGADMAAKLTRELLTLGRRDLRTPQPLVLDQVVADVRGFLERVIPSDIEIVVDLNAAEAATELDPVHAEQVLLNLALNARDAMPDGGTLTIRTSVEDLPKALEVRRPELAHTSCVCVSVTDTGQGMDDEVLAHVFEPYFTTKATGSGLGLATVFGIIEESGGILDVTSVLAEGTRFRVYLPRTEMAPAPRAEPEAEVPTTGGDEWILVVDDDERVRELVASMLTSAGYRVVTAQDGEDGLAVARAFDGSFDLLVSDIMMPRLKGPQLYEQLKIDDPGLKVLFISGYSEQRDLMQTIPSEEGAFLRKPFRRAELLGTVRALLGVDADGRTASG